MSVLFANLVFEGCILRSDQRKAIIEIGACKSSEEGNKIQFHHVRFEDNVLRPGMALAFHSISCSALEMQNAEFLNNACQGVCWAMLSGQNDLKQIQIRQNLNTGDENTILSILHAKSNSQTRVSFLQASDNQGTVFFVSKASLSISDSSFANNSISEVNTSPCIHLDKSAARMERIEFVENEGIRGASIYSMSSTANLIDSEFRKNQGVLGGAVYIQNSTFQIDQCVFVENTAAENGGAIFGSNIHLNLTNLSFNRSKAARGGALYASHAEFTISESILSENEAELGAGLYIVDDSDGVIQNLAFERNTAHAQGGGIYLLLSSLMMNKTTFIFNKAETLGGGCYCDNSIMIVQDSHAVGNSANDGGVFFVWHDANTTFIRSNFFENMAPHGGALGIVIQGSADIQNCTFYKNTAEMFGGSIKIDAATTVTIQDSHIGEGSASHGGGVFSRQTKDILFQDSTCEGNSAVFGGCFSIEESDLKIQNSIVRGNNATYGGTAYVTSFSSLYLTNVMLHSNIANSAGGSIHLTIQSVLDGQNVSFIQNKAIGTNAKASSFTVQSGFDRVGGTVFSENSTIELKNSVFKQSRSEINSGFLFAQGKSNVTLKACQMSGAKSTFGGAISLERSRLVGIQLTITDCVASKDGGAIQSTSSSTLLCSQCIFKNNRALAHGGAVSVETGKAQRLAVQFDKSLFENNTASIGGEISHPFLKGML